MAAYLAGAKRGRGAGGEQGWKKWELGERKEHVPSPSFSRLLTPPVLSHSFPVYAGWVVVLCVCVDHLNFANSFHLR